MPSIFFTCHQDFNKQSRFRVEGSRYLGGLDLVLFLVHGRVDIARDGQREGDVKPRKLDVKTLSEAVNGKLSLRACEKGEEEAQGTYDWTLEAQ